jgi:hypothetical protein
MTTNATITIVNAIVAVDRIETLIAVKNVEEEIEELRLMIPMSILIAEVEEASNHAMVVTVAQKAAEKDMMIVIVKATAAIHGMGETLQVVLWIAIAILVNATKIRVAKAEEMKRTGIVMTETSHR